MRHTLHNVGLNNTQAPMEEASCPVHGSSADHPSCNITGRGVFAHSRRPRTASTPLDHSFARSRTTSSHDLASRGSLRPMSSHGDTRSDRHRLLEDQLDNIHSLATFQTGRSKLVQHSTLWPDEAWVAVHSLLNLQVSRMLTPRLHNPSRATLYGELV